LKINSNYIFTLPFFFILYLSLFCYLFIIFSNYFHFFSIPGIYYYKKIILLIALFAGCISAISKSKPNNFSILKVRKENLFILLLAICFFGYLIILTIFKPYPPIFNIHSYSALDLGYYYQQNSRLPFFDVNKMITIAAQSNLYSQLNIFGFILSAFDLFKLDKLDYIISSNLLSQFIFIASALFVSSLFEKNKLLAFMSLILIILSLPPLYEVFIKYPSSDVFSLFCSSGILVFSIKAFKEKKIHFLILLIAFSNILRTYFALIAFIFFLLFNFFYYLKKRREYIIIVKKLFNKKINVLFILFSFFISISWFNTLYSNYGVINPDFRKILSFNDNYELDQKSMIEDYSTALISSNLFEKNSLNELSNSILNTNIYYKTFQKTENHYNSSFINTLLKYIFSTPVIFLALIILFFISCRHLLIKKRYQNEIKISILWLLSVSISWLALFNSPYPIVKILLVGLPAFAIVITLFFIDIYDKKIFSNYFIKLIFVFFLSSFLFNNNLYSSNYINSKSEISKPENDFFEKYGNKKSVLNFFSEYNIDNSEIIWMIRPEHGGFISFFIDDIRLWDRKWYENPDFNDIHIAVSYNQIFDYLKKEKISYLISMKDQSLKRFYYDPFNTILGYENKIISLLNDNDVLLEKIFEETVNKGLELSIYRIKN